jgi:hypothetical protein
MKICISEGSVKDFNAFFKAKALELHGKNKFKNIDDLYKALYNEALNLSGDSNSISNHDVVIQHLAMAPLGLNNVIPELQTELAESLAKALEAFSSPTKLESLINQLQEKVSTPLDVVEEEVEDYEDGTEDSAEEDYPEGAIHIHFDTTIGSETYDFENAVNQDKALAFQAKRTVLNAVMKGDKGFKLLAMTYDKAIAKYGDKLDLSISAKPKAGNESQMVVMIISDAQGNPVEFAKDGTVTEKGAIPLYSTPSPSVVNETAYDYFVRGNKTGKDNPKGTDPNMYAKFQALEQNAIRQAAKARTEYNPKMLENFYLGEESTVDGKKTRSKLAWGPIYKQLFVKIRQSDGYLLDISQATSTHGYNETTNVKTQLSDIQGIENYSIDRVDNKGNYEYRVSGSLLHDKFAPIIPNDIQGNSEAVETLVRLLTDKTLTFNGTKITPAQVREFVSNYIGITNDKPGKKGVTKGHKISFDDKGQLYIYGKKAGEKELREFFTSFKAYAPVDGNPQNRTITNDLSDSNNTSAMLYQDANGKMYKIYKPKFSFVKGRNFKSISIDESGVIKSTPVETKAHMIANSSTKAFINSNGELRAYHPKLGYQDTANKHTGLTKTAEQKEADTFFDERTKKLINDRALSWFGTSPLSNVLELNDQRANLEDSPFNRNIVARWVGDGITLFAGAENRDLYHEAWHAYTQGLLTIEEKQKLYAQVRKMKGMKNKTNLQVEEWLADEFQKYAEGKSKVKKTTAIGRFFEALLNMFKSLFGNYSKTDLQNDSVFQDIVNTHFKNLYTNNIDVSKYSQANFMFQSLNKNLEFDTPSGTKRLSAQNTATLLNAVDVLLVQHMDTKITDQLEKGYHSVKDFEAGYRHVLQELTALRKQAEKDLDKIEEVNGIESPEFTVQLEKTQTLIDAIDNFGDLENFENNMTNGETGNTVISFHLKNSKVNNYNVIKNLVEEDGSYQDEDQANGKIFERTGNDQSLYDMAYEHIVYLLSTIPKYETKRKRVTQQDVLTPGSKYTLNDIGKVEFFEEAATSDLGLNVLERPVVVMAKLGKLLNSSNNGDEMHAKMVEAAQEDPTINAVLNKLGNYHSKSLDQQNLWSKFIQTFSKSNNKIQQFIIEAKVKNNQISIESKYGSTIGGERAVSRAWDAAFPTMKSDFLEVTPDGTVIKVENLLNEFLDDKGDGKWDLKRDDSYVEFFRALGINITDKADIENELAQNHEVLTAFANRLKSHLEVNDHLSETGKPTRNITSIKELVGSYQTVSSEGKLVKQDGIRGRFNKLQNIEYNLSDKYNSFMSPTAKGETQSELSLNNTASIITNDINGIAEGTHIDKVIEQNSHLSFLHPSDPMMKANTFFKALFDENGYRTKIKINFENFSGSSLLQDEQSTGLSNMGLDRASKFMTDVYLSWLNKSEVVRMADKTTSMHVGLQQKQVINPENLTDSPTDVTMFNALRDYLVAEIVRINKLAEIQKSGKAFDQSYVKQGQQFYIFEDILSNKILADLQKIKSTDFNAVSDVISKYKNLDQIIAEINDYFTTKTDEAIAAHSKDLFITDNIIEQMQEMVEEELTEQRAKEIMIGMYARNKFMHNLDFSTFYLGDPALYKILKEDFHKRNAGVISTGEVFRTDSSFLNFINSRNEQGQLQSRGWSNVATQSKHKYTEYDGRITTAVITDHEIASQYQEHYSQFIDDLGEYTTDPKTGEGLLNEADGQGFISFDAYRMLSISQGIWSNEQEDQYNLIVDRGGIDADGNLVPGKYDQTKYSTFFPSMKLQYFGPVEGKENLGMRMQAFHKFNLVPLIPGMIQGTKLETLHQKMMEQGVDYMTFDSGSKVSTVTKADGQDQFYNADRTLNEDLVFEPNILHAKYLKNQLKIHNKFKGKVTLPTQMRKILVSGLFNKDGSYKEGMEEWHKNYLSVLSKLTAYKKQELENELGITDELSLIKNSEKLVNMIRREFTDKDYTEHQIEFLFENNQLKKDISTALNAAQVEKLLISLVDKRVTKIKVSGEGLIQVASTMTEKKGSVQVENDLEAGTNGLRAYYNDNGEVKGMQVKIALQGNFEKLLFANDLNGKKIAKFKKTTLEDGTVQKELDYDASLARLNEVIKDKAWVEKHRDIITISAPRIPSQAFNSLEFMEVAEFLPKNSGNVMVVASEIVAKSGSDFDVDKLFTMFPNFAVYNGVPQMIKYTDINTDVDALSNTKSNLKSKLQIANDQISDLLAEKEGYAELLDINFKLRKLNKERKNLENSYDILANERLIEIDGEIAKLRDSQESYIGEAIDEVNQPQDSDIIDQLKKRNETLTPLFDTVKSINAELAEVQKKIDGATVKGLENELLKSIVDRLKMTEVFPELIKPNSTKMVKEDLVDKYNLGDVATDYKKKKKVRGTESNSISPTQIFDPLYNINKQIENSVGMETLGIGAIGSSYYAVFQSIGMYINMNNGQEVGTEEFMDYSIGLKHNTRTETRYDETDEKGLKRKIDTVEVIDMASEFGSSGQSIPDILGQLINGWVDVAKDAWVFNLQGNKEVSPTLIYLVSAGVDLKEAVMLSSSRMVREYISKKQASKSAFNGLSKLNRTNSKTFDLIQYENDIDLLNEVLLENDKEPIGSVEEASQIREALDMKSIEDFVLNPEQEITQDRINKEEDALLHFFTYENTAAEITALTQATKFDTATSATLAEIRNNQIAFDTLHEQAALPTNIKTKMLKDSPIGMFETNGLQLKLWGGFFSLRTHQVLADKANETYKGKLYIGGRSKADNQKDYSEEFISYVYQNEYSRIHNNRYKQLELNPVDEDIEEGYIADGKFFFNEAEVEKIVADGVLGNKNSVIKYYIEKALVAQDLDMTSEKVTSSISYQIALNSEELNLKPGQEGYDALLRDEYLEAEATIRSGNSVQLFMGDYSFKKRMDALKNKFPSLEKQFSLVRDLTPDVMNIDEYNTIDNLYLPNLQESGYRDVYEENLAILKENPHPEIKQLFKMFDRFAVLQSGLKSFGKYPMTSFINPNHVERYVGPVRENLVKTMDEVVNPKADRTSVPIVNAFDQIYFQKGDAYNFKTFIRNKHRFAQFETDAYFGTDVQMKVQNIKLSDYNGTIEGVRFPKTFEMMADKADKIIITKTTKAPNKNYYKESLINKLNGELNQKHSHMVDDTYESSDTVWIVGEDMNTDATSGNAAFNKTWKGVLDKTFDSYKMDIDQAIGNGVESFVVGPKMGGVDQMAKDYLNEIRDEDTGDFMFKMHTVIHPDGKHYAFTKNPEMVVHIPKGGGNKTVAAYSTGVPEINIGAQTPELLMMNTEGAIILKDRTSKNAKIREGKPESNIYKYMVNLKSQYASKASKAKLAERMKAIEGELTHKDFATLMNTMKVRSDQPYDEVKELAIAIIKIAEQDSNFKKALLETGKALLNYEGLTSGFNTNFALAMMRIRAYDDLGYNGPVTKASENTDEDGITCAS